MDLWFASRDVYAREKSRLNGKDDKCINTLNNNTPLIKKEKNRIFDKCCGRMNHFAKDLSLTNDQANYNVK